MDTKINDINIRRVLRQIWNNDGISRAEISREIALGKSTVTKIVTSLLDSSIVKVDSHGQAGPNGGRRPINLVMNNKFGYIVGLEIQLTYFTAIAIDLRGRVLLSHSERIDIDGEQIASAFRAILQNLKRRLRSIQMPLLGVGVGVPGIVDPFSGVIIRSNTLNIRDRISFSEQAAKHLNVPVLVENDANCCCWGELAFKKSDRHRNFMLVLGEFRTGRTKAVDDFGPAVGIGIVLNKKVYYGEEFSAGEFQSIEWKRGNKTQFAISDRDALRVREDRRVRRRVFREISKHVALLVNTLNLTCVVFGGELASYRDELLPIVRDEIRKNWGYDTPVNCSTEFASLEERTVAYGAAAMFLERLFAMPDVVDSVEYRIPISIDAIYDSRERVASGSR